MNGIDVADVLIRTNDEDVIKDECVWQRVGVANRDNGHTNYEGTSRGLVFIEQVHPLILQALASGQSNIE